MASDPSEARLSAAEAERDELHTRLQQHEQASGGARSASSTAATHPRALEDAALALARSAQLEEALRELQGAGVVVWHQASVGSGQVDIGPLDELADALAAAWAVLAGGTPPPGEQTDAGDARGVAAEDTGLSGGSE